MISGDLAASRYRPLGHRGVELAGRHDLVDDPDPLGLLGGDLLAEQEQLGRLLARDVAVDQRHDHEREGAHVDLGRPEAHPFAGDDQVARERDPERPGEQSAAQMLGLPSSPISRNRRGKRAVPRCLCTSGCSSAKPPRFRAGGEHLLVRGGQYDAADRLVVARGLERRDQLVQDLVGERVARLGLVEHASRDAARGHLVAQGFEGHGRRYRRRAASCATCRLFDAVCTEIRTT